MSNNLSIEELDATGPLPVVVAERLRRAVVSGEYAVGTRLPPEPSLSVELGVSRSTLRDALAQLEREGLVLRRQRLGTVVLRRPVLRNSLSENYGVREMIEASGRRHTTRDTEIRFVTAPDDVRQGLELEPEAEVTSLERTRLADEEPVVVTIDYLDAHTVQSATAPLVPDVSIYRWLKDHCQIAVAYGVARVRAIAAEGDVVRRLEVSPGEAIFQLTQIDYTAGGCPVLFSQEFHRADAFEVSVLRRGPYA
jgi:DNA-binding GntR family transcriptional regulator